MPIRILDHGRGPRHDTRGTTNPRLSAKSCPPLWRDVAETLLLIALIVWLTMGPQYLFTASPDLRDFQTFYASGRAWLAGQDLYASTGQNMNPPAFVLATVPFALLPLRTSLVIWWIVNAIAAAIAIRIVLQETGFRLTRVHVLIALGFAGTRSQLFLGQTAWLLMLPATLGWRAYRRGDDARAGVWWGLLIAVKPIFLPVLLGFLWRRRYRTAGATIATGAAISLVGLLGGGIAGYRSWLSTGHGVFWFFRELNASILGMVSRVGLAPSWRFALWVLLCASVVALTWRRRRIPQADADALTWVLVSLLIAPLGWVYYLPLALGPFVAVTSTHRWPRWSWVAMAGLFWPPGVLWSPTAAPTPVLIASLYGLSTLALWWLATSPSVEQGVATRPHSPVLVPGPEPARAA